MVDVWHLRRCANREILRLACRALLRPAGAKDFSESSCSVYQSWCCCRGCAVSSPWQPPLLLPLVVDVFGLYLSSLGYGSF